MDLVDLGVVLQNLEDDGDGEEELEDHGAILQNIWVSATETRDLRNKAKTLRVSKMAMTTLRVSKRDQKGNSMRDLLRNSKRNAKRNSEMNSKRNSEGNSKKLQKSGAAPAPTLVWARTRTLCK